jgi:hypothetical protein
VRAEAHRALFEHLKRFAAEREHGIAAGEYDTGFHTDTVLMLRDCSPWIADTADRHVGLTAADIEAAVTSVYVEAVSRCYATLFALYEHEIACMLSKQLSYTVRAIGLRFDGDAIRETVLNPMARYFLESLRTLISDPNRFGFIPRRGRIVVTPFAWSPRHDDLEAFLSLLITHQAGRRFLPNALCYSPLAYHLRAEGLADVIDVRRRLCRRCHKDIASSVSGDTCPDCGRPLVHIRTKQLARVMDAVLQADSMPGPLDGHEPRDTAEFREGYHAAAVIAVQRAWGLWRKALELRARGILTLTVMAALARFDSAIGCETLAHPPEGGLLTMVKVLLAASVPGRDVTVCARRLLPGLCVALGADTVPALKVGNVRAIVLRLRRRLGLAG